ncbi:hypothetical protein D9757_008546 [Collybiopsis confluens]|uniref:Wax synthase domain-containing protein n=1 Tax=Collybiopsis confluens TaxID=2823264 RepID=A0A8H5H2N4_9AGAR|nr:hypothetical protein D9757_008546 [Collybiopsis confluens]
MARNSLDVHSFFTLLLPPIVIYYTLAALLCLPRTRLLRLALLPPSLILAYRAASSLDLSYGNDRLVYLNKGLVLAMTSLCFRAIIWAMSREPYKRLQAVNESASSKTKLFLDASDLAFGLRGIGRNWSRGLHIPQETRPLSSKMAFVSWTLLSLCVHIPLLDLMHYTVQSFGPNTFGTVKGGSIFDDDLPPITRYARSTFISFISGIVVYCAIRVSYDFSTIIGVLVLNQLPIQWPKVFDSPWKASSLSDFWAKRWHQLFRHFFIGIGSVPLYCAFGRVGSVLGAFLVSGLLHYVGLFGLGNGSDIMGMVGFFLLMGCGVLLEALWKKITGQRVGGWSGRIWTMVWLLGWSNLLVDAWARKGLIGALFIPDSQRLPVKLFGPLQTS